MIYRKKRIPTVTLERHVLHYLTTSKIILQGYMTTARDEWFTSEARYYIFAIARKLYEENHTILTETQLAFEADAMFAGKENDTKRQDLLAEFNEIKAVKPDDEISVIVSRLNDALLGMETEDLIMSAYSSLESGDVDEALSKLKQGSLSLRKPDEESSVVSLWEETGDWIAEIKNRRDFPEKYAGIPTGFKKFDELTGGLFPAELTMIFGLSGKGKSTLMKQIGVNVRKAGYNVLHCGNEENKFQMRTKYTAVETGIKYSHWKNGKFTDVELKAFEEYRDEQLSNNSGKLHIFNFPQQTDANMIERRLVELKAKGERIDLVIVDYLDLMSSIKRAFNENDEGGRVTGDLKQIAVNFNIPVLVCTQAATDAEKQETREKPFLTAADVFGTKRKVHSANVLIGIVNQTATVDAGLRNEAELKRHRLVICVPKNRDGPVFTFRLIIEVETGRVIPDDENDPQGKLEEEVAVKILKESTALEMKANKELTSKEKEINLAKLLEQKIMDNINGIDANSGEATIMEANPDTKQDLTSIKGLLKKRKNKASMLDNIKKLS